MAKVGAQRRVMIERKCQAERFHWNGDALGSHMHEGWTRNRAATWCPTDEQNRLIHRRTRRAALWQHAQGRGLNAWDSRLPCHSVGNITFIVMDQDP